MGRILRFGPGLVRLTSDIHAGFAVAREMKSAVERRRNFSIFFETVYGTRREGIVFERLFEY